MPDLEMLTTVALLEDVPRHNLRRGQVGTIVENLAPGIYEVEFSDDAGQTYASIAVAAGNLIRLYHEPNREAA